MKKDSLDDRQELFYLELRPTASTDYFEDIEIQDEYEDHEPSPKKGLSDEQVSQIARDSLNAAKLHQPHRPTASSDEPQTPSS